VSNLHVRDEEKAVVCFLEAHPKFDIFHCGVRIACIKPAESHEGLSP
jgi:hypothetical protein